MRTKTQFTEYRSCIHLTHCIGKQTDKKKLGADMFAQPLRNKNRISALVLQFAQPKIGDLKRAFQKREEKIYRNTIKNIPVIRKKREVTKYPSKTS
jgi:hypothetical protein